jgi:SSS family solute:Na+ symporter
MTAGIVVMGAGTLIYTIAGGMKAVLWTDVLQFAMKVLGGILLLVFVLTHLPKGFEELVEIGKAAHKFQILNLSVDPAEPLTIWSGLIGGCFVTLATHGTDQLIAQRCLSAKSLRHAQVAMALSGLIVFLLFALFLTVGVALYVLKVRGLFPVTDDINNDQVVPIAIGTLLPPGVAGLLLATLIASSMSTFAASLNSLSAVSISDIPWRRTSALTETQKLKGARVATLFWAALQFAVAFLAAGFQEQRSLISTVMSISALPLGVVLGLFAVTWFTKEISRTATLLGVLSGLTVIAILVGTNFFGKTWLGWPWYTALVAVTVTVTSLAATAQLRPR